MPHPNTPRITHAMLRTLRACSDQRALFRKHYPNGAPLTHATARKAMRLGFDLDWLVVAMVPANSPARATYEEVKRPAWASYEEVKRAAWATYEEVKRAARATYEEVERAARATYEEATRPAWASYVCAIAPAAVSAIRAVVNEQ